MCRMDVINVLRDGDMCTYTHVHACTHTEEKKVISKSQVHAGLCPGFKMHT